jgi:aryl-alcohol dehydrogenase-like predicted oxidoreductase
MENRKLGSTGLKVSEICFGTATFGWHTDEAESHRMLDTFLEAGGNFVDTADIYSGWAEGSWAGRSEEMIGTWLKDSGRRHEIVLATKCRSAMGDLPNDAGLSRRHIMDAVEASLKRLNTDFIDLYQTHSMDNQTPIEETMRALDDLVRQGKVRYLGCSNYSAWRLCKALWAADKQNLARYDCIQPYYSLLERDHFERELADLVEVEGVAVIPYSPQALGFLTGKFRGMDAVPPNTRGADNKQMQSYFTEKNFALLDEMEKIGQHYGKTLGQVSLAWLLTNPLITAPIVGARNTEQLQESIAAAGFRLENEHMEHLNQLTEWRNG